jgi:iron complex transport system substrate-binding protein
MNRIASLLPSATEIVALLGLESKLVGRTHECDYPLSVEGVPVLTHADIQGAHLSSREIDDKVRASLGGHHGSSIYGIEEDAWRTAAPDLILTQELCDVCAVNYDRVVEAARLLQGDTTIISLEPRTLNEMLANIRTVGEVTDTTTEAESAIAALQARLDDLSTKTAALPKQKVVCIEWLDPIFCAGHWVAEQVELAGGIEGLAVAGEPSIRKTWEDVLASAPDVLILLPCGFDVPRVLAEVDILRNQPGWETIPAVQQGEVYAVNGHAYFNRPGPRLVDGAELVAGLLHPEQFGHFRDHFEQEGSWQKVEPSRVMA